jgi:hypothetical protein
MDKISKALTADEVFQIADPVLTLNILSEFNVPMVKVDLKEKLAIELNRKILQSNGEARAIGRKQLKRLLSDKMTLEEQKKTLGILFENHNEMKPIYNNKIREHEHMIENHLSDIEQEKKKYLDEISKLKKKDGKIANSKKEDLQELVHMMRQDIEKSKEKIKTLNKKLEEPDEPDTEKLIKLNETIINASERQKELEDKAIISLTKESDINPAAYEKTLNERISESNTLFQNIINNGTNPHIVLPFERIRDHNSVNELFVDENGRISNMVLIIYRSEVSFGHWCCLTRSNDLRSLTYFNPYGSYIDKAIDYIPKQFADISRQNFPYLLKLLNECDYEIHWNDTQLQLMKPGIATCGRHCGLWMNYNKRGVSIENYVEPFKAVKLEERDEIIVKLTEPFLNS